MFVLTKDLSTSQPQRCSLDRSRMHKNLVGCIQSKALCIIGEFTAFCCVSFCWCFSLSTQISLLQLGHEIKLHQQTQPHGRRTHGRSQLPVLQPLQWIHPGYRLGRQGVWSYRMNVLWSVLPRCSPFGSFMFVPPEMIDISPQFQTHAFYN